jgi:hypothetical protein
MSIQNRGELEVTREKLRRLEEQYEMQKRKPAENERVREWTLRSLRKLINQMKEEIVRYQSHENLQAKGR